MDHPRRRKLHVGVAIVAITALWLMAVSATAQAEKDVRRPTTTRAVDPGTDGHATAKCPAGYRVVGGGVTNTAGYDQANVIGTRPEDGPDPGSARNDAWIGFLNYYGGPDPIRIKVFAICVKGELKAGLRYVTKRIHYYDAHEQVTETARCPDGASVVGGGVSVGRGGLGYPIVTRREGRNAWKGVFDILFSPIVTTYAICSRGQLERGLTYVTKTREVDEATQGHVTAKCPRGSWVLGGGVGSEAAFEQASINATRPEDGPDPGSARNDAWIGFVDNYSEDAKNALEIKAYAICRESD